MEAEESEEEDDVEDESKREQGGVEPGGGAGALLYHLLVHVDGLEKDKEEDENLHQIKDVDPTESGQSAYSKAQPVREW